MEDISPQDYTQDAPRVGRRALRLLDYELSVIVVVIAFHLASLGFLYTGSSARDWVAFGVLYAVRLIGVTAGYHRYFSHRAYKTSRLAQFLLAFLAETSAQRGVIWWAAWHRLHHRHSDQPNDAHSPRRWGFWHAHMGWLFDGNNHTPAGVMRDFERFPELRILDRLWLLPPALLGMATLWWGGWSAFFAGFMLSTVALWHATFTINSLAHQIGVQRFDTGDDSRNHLGLALLTFGEGWHNNHHHSMSSARHGIRWQEIDITYCALRLAEKLGLVWDLRERPSSP